MFERRSIAQRMHIDPLFAVVKKDKGSLQTVARGPSERGNDVECSFLHSFGHVESDLLSLCVHTYFQEKQTQFMNKRILNDLDTHLDDCSNLFC